MSDLPIVIATGQLLTARLWDPLAALWGTRRVIHADTASDNAITAMADRLLAAAPPRFVLIGQAMGGFVAFEVMRRAPERVERLVLLSTLAEADGPAQTARRLAYAAMVEAGRFADVVEQRIPLLFPPIRRSDPRLLSMARAMARDTGAAAFLRQQQAIMTRIDSRAGAAQITCPTLIVWGAEDGIATRAQQDEMKAAIPGARLETIAGAGHLPTIELPGQVVRILAPFLGLQL